MLTIHALFYMLSMLAGKTETKPVIRKEISMTKDTKDSNFYQKQIEELRRENVQLKEQLQTKAVFIGKNGNIACRVNNRAPINLYRDQWETILTNAARIKEMLLVNKDKLRDAPEQAEPAEDTGEQYNVA